jgi:hypothetical protein
MEGHGCELAVRIDGKPYFVDGTCRFHGDAHASDGFCTAIRKASVIGEIKTIDLCFTIQITTRRKENKAKLVSLIIQNSTKHIAHTQKES